MGGGRRKNWDGWSKVEDWSLCRRCNTEEPVLIPLGCMYCHHSKTHEHKQASETWGKKEITNCANVLFVQDISAEKQRLVMSNTLHTAGSQQWNTALSVLDRSQYKSHHCYCIETAAVWLVKHLPVRSEFHPLCSYSIRPLYVLITRWCEGRRYLCSLVNEHILFLTTLTASLDLIIPANLYQYYFMIFL